MRKKAWKLMALAALVIAEFSLDVKLDLFSVRAESDQSSSVSELENELAQQFQSRSGRFTVQYTGDKQELSDNLQGVIKKALSHDDYTAYILDSYLYTIRSWGNRSTIKLEARYRETKEQTAEVDHKVKQTLAVILTESMNDHQKVKAIHDWIVSHLEYDQSLSKYTAYEALTTGRAVCQGYSLLALRMLQEAGVTTIIAEGTVDTGDHAWNMVKLDGSWYHLDMTWDDPIREPSKQQSQQAIRYSYYLKTDQEMRVDHQWVKVYPEADQPYIEELKQLEHSDSANAAVYNQLITELGLHWLDQGNTIANSDELADMIRTNILEQEESIQFRYLNGKELPADLKEAFEKAGIPIGYSASYEPYSNDGSMLVRIQLSYS